MSIDGWIDERAASLHGHPVLDAVMYGASWFGDDGRGWIAASLVRSRWSAAPATAFARQMAWLGIESALVNGPVKGAVRRARPAALPRTHPYRFRAPSNSSFPSGHAASAATMAALLSEDGLAPLWWTLAVAVGASRIYVGVHHASDVAAGLAVGTVIGLAARRIELPHLPNPGPRPA